MNKQEMFTHAVNHARGTLNDNQELFLAQIIKTSPEINLLNYRVCHKPIEHEGSFGESFWLEEIK